MTGEYTLFEFPHHLAEMVEQVLKPLKIANSPAAVAYVIFEDYSCGIKINLFKAAGNTLLNIVIAGMYTIQWRPRTSTKPGFICRIVQLKCIDVTSALILYDFYQRKCWILNSFFAPTLGWSALSEGRLRSVVSVLIENSLIFFFRKKVPLFPVCSYWGQLANHRSFAVRRIRCFLPFRLVRPTCQLKFDDPWKLSVLFVHCVVIHSFIVKVWRGWEAPCGVSLIPWTRGSFRVYECTKPEAVGSAPTKLLVVPIVRI